MPQLPDAVRRCRDIAGRCCHVRFWANRIAAEALTAVFSKLVRDQRRSATIARDPDWRKPRRYKRYQIVSARHSCDTDAV